MQVVNDNFRVWTISTHRIAFSWKFYLVPIIENQENVDEYLGTLRMIERTDFNQLSPMVNGRGWKRENN